MLPEKHTLMEGTHAKLQELDRELQHQAVVKRVLAQQEHRASLLARLGGWLLNRGDVNVARQRETFVQPSKLATDSGIHRIR